MSEAQTNQITISGVLDPKKTETDFHFADGRVIRLPTALLERTPARESEPESTGEVGQISIPIVEEQLEVAKRVVLTGKVYLRMSVDTYDIKLDEPLAVEQWRIERVAKNVVVGEAPATRLEGQTTVYPVIEERLVLTKELVLVEEIHVTRAVSERRDTQTVVLRREKLKVDREDVSSRPG